MKNLKDRKLKAQHLKKLFGLALLLFSVFSCTKKKEVLENRPVVRVGQTELTSQVMAKEMLNRLKSTSVVQVRNPKEIDRIKEEIISDFIASTLSQRFAEKVGIRIKASDIETYINQVRSSYPDDLSFKHFLAEENLSFKDWRKLIIKRLTHDQVILKLRERIQEPTEKELKNFYSKNKKEFSRPTFYSLQQIFVKKEEDADALLERIKAGGNLEILAKKYSESPEGEKGGYLKKVEKGTLEVFDEAIEKAVKRPLKFKSPYGFHIIKYLGKMPAKTMSYKEVIPEIRQRIVEKRQEAVYSKWLERELSEVSVWKDREVIKSLNVQTSSR